MQINTEIQRQLEANGDWSSSKNTHYITVGANPSTLRSFIEINSTTYQVDMASSTIRTMLGFNPQTLTSGYHEGESPVNILTVNTILVNCDITSGSFLSGTQQPVVYSFFPTSHRAIRLSSHRITYFICPLAKQATFRECLTDQTGMQLNLRDEVVTIRLHIRQCLICSSSQALPVS